MRYEVGRDTPFRLDPGATSLAVGLDFAIFTFKHNIKVIQNRHLRNWRHWSPQSLCSEVKSTWRSRTIWVWCINLTSPLIMSAGRRVYFPIPDHTHTHTNVADKRRFNPQAGVASLARPKSVTIGLHGLLRMSGYINDMTERLHPLFLRSHLSFGRKCRGGRAVCFMEAYRRYYNWSRKYTQ